MITNNSFEHGGNIHKAKRDKNIEFIDFSANINSLGLSLNVENAIKSNIKNIVNYPDPDGYELKNKLSDYYDIPIEYITLGNGAVELLYVFCNIVRPKNVMIMAPSFCEYERAALASKANIIYHYLQAEENFAVNTVEVEKKLKDIDILFLCNPNNPTGTLIERLNIENLLKKAKENNTLVLVDESFIDFIDNSENISCRTLISKYDNLIILHSLTKFYAIPGLRLGFMLANYELTQRMHLSKDPWNVNTLAQVAGVAALQDKEYQEKSIKNLVNTKSDFYDKLNNISKLIVYQPSVNYVFLNIKNTGFTAIQLQTLLLAENILIRNCDNYPGLSKYYIRVAIKDECSNNLLIKALEKIIGD